MLLEKDRERDGQREMECYYKKKLVRKKEKRDEQIQEILKRWITMELPKIKRKKG